MKYGLLAAVALILLVPGLARAELITFDDLPGVLNPVPNGYGNLDWINMYTTNLTHYGAVNGYINGTVSPINVAFNGYGDPAEILAAPGQTFTFDSVDLTGAWYTGLTVEMVGSLNGQTVFDYQERTSAFAPTLFTNPSNTSPIDTLMMTSFGGEPAGFVEGNGNNFAMDNLVVNPQQVPAPAAIALGLVGLGLVGRFARRTCK